MSQSSSFSLLDERIQRYIYAEGWDALRDVQEAAIPLILKADHDVIISAATAVGKTEAAFLPALTHLLSQTAPGLIIYISPLKALINDQFGRLDMLCQQLDLPVWPWHGDIGQHVKSKFMSRRCGVLLITPESLEAILCNRGAGVRGMFEKTIFVVIDELHSFMGTERGKQLQSLMRRIEIALGHTVARIGLSATLGDMALAADFLRPKGGTGVALVKSASGASELKIQVKGYLKPLAGQSSDQSTPDATTPDQVAVHMFQNLRGSNNLVFPNSKREVEHYTYILSKMCEQENVPNEFWPHHGSLSKEIRSDTEASLKEKERPSTALCTNTLELGIDIGAVKSVAQIGPPPSVASLRQRMGRSGRRKGEPAILRGYIIENEVEERSSLRSELRLDTLQFIAMISLMLKGWFEPAPASSLHMSTLVQQVLSLVAQMGGIRIGDLYGILCGKGAPFEMVAPAEFQELVRELGVHKMLVMDSSGELLHGEAGEKAVNHYTFYAAFSSVEEYRLINNGRHLGSLPISQMLAPNQRLLFAGKTWKIEQIDQVHKVIEVSHSPGGVPPMFMGGLGLIHTCIRQEMKQILMSDAPVVFLDGMAQSFLEEGRRNFKRRSLGNMLILDRGQKYYLMTWMGDTCNQALAVLLRAQGFMADADGPSVAVDFVGHNVIDIKAALAHISDRDVPSLEELLPKPKALMIEKWDAVLPAAMLRKGYSSRHFNFTEAISWASFVSKNYPNPL